jgi:glycine cleavage system transcriptional repressor
VSDFAVTAIGRDRPGIVAAISSALLDLEGNIADSQMSILRGHFAVMLVVHVPDAIDEEELANALGGVRDQLGLEAITYNQLEHVAPGSPEPTHVLTVHGADHPGIVAGVSAALAELGVNITDLETRLASAADSPIYMMVMELAMEGASVDAVNAALRETAGRAGVDFTLRELEADAL